MRDYEVFLILAADNWRGCVGSDGSQAGFSDTTCIPATAMFLC